ncbi:hypothetical protein Rs2_41259 [Raphanus sativus]|nr:hypothetical protein Rs2_41259 [Raphanus sativus]
MGNTQKSNATIKDLKNISIAAASAINGSRKKSLGGGGGRTSLGGCCESGLVTRGTRFWAPGVQTDVLGTGRPDQRHGRRVAIPMYRFWAPGGQTDVPALGAGRPDRRPGSRRRAARPTSRLWAPGGQTDVLGARWHDRRHGSGHRAARPRFWAPGCGSFGKCGQFLVKLSRH